MSREARRSGGLGSVEDATDGLGPTSNEILHETLSESGVEMPTSPALRRARRRLLVEILRPHRGRLGLAALCVAVSSAAVVSIPSLVRVGIDRGIGPRNRLTLLVVLVLLVAAAVTDALSQRAGIRLVGRAAEDAVYDLRTRLWRHVQGLSIDWFERQKAGRVISRATTDVEAVYELFSQAALALVTSVLTMSAIAVVLVITDPVLGGVVLAIIPILLGATWLFKGRSELAYRAVREKIALVLVHLAESLTGIRVVQAFTREPLNYAQFEDINSQHLRANADTVRLMSFYGPGVELLGQLGVVLVLLVGGFRALDGRISVGTLTAFLLYLRQFFDPLQELSQFFNSWQAANAGLEKIAGVLQAGSTVPEAVDPEPLTGPPGVGPVAGVQVRLEGVTFSYGRESVLHQVDLTIAAGEKIALVGATGAGKSTIAKLVARFYDPTEGRVLVDGHDLCRVSTSELRAAIAVVPQEAFLFSGTVHDNIALGRRGVTRAQVEAAATAVGADTFIADMPQGYDTDVDRRGARLSGGQRQLISFARAWIGNPRVLILDEATSSLDLRSERLVQRALDKLLVRRTAIVIAHRLSSISLADRVAVVEGGQIVELGSQSELLALGGRFAALQQRWVATMTAGSRLP